MSLRQAKDGQIEVAALVTLLQREWERKGGNNLRVNDAMQRHLTAIVDSAAKGRRPPDFDLIGRPDKPDSNGSFVLFVGTSDSIVVSDAVSPADRRAICYTAIEAKTVISDSKLDARLDLAERLGNRVKRWDNFHESGYSMYLPELLINSWVSLGRPPLEPPVNQLIVLHPSIALAAPVPLRRGVDGSDVMLLELAGLVRYNGDRSRFFGVSPATVFAQRELPGFGFLGHIGTTTELGFIWRKGSADTGGGNRVILSADLLKAFNSMPGGWREELDLVKGSLADCVRRFHCTP